MLKIFFEWARKTFPSILRTINEALRIFRFIMCLYVHIYIYYMSVLNQAF